MHFENDRKTKIKEWRYGKRASNYFNAGRCENHCLPRHVHLMFDDFACGAKINDFSRHISIFRSAGLSALILLQSESQLCSLYSEYEATTILNNCSSYVYLPGGMDLMTCRSVAERFDIPESEVKFAPVGKAFVMQAGREPVITQRYDTKNDLIYQDYQEQRREAAKRFQADLAAKGNRRSGR